MALAFSYRRLFALGLVVVLSFTVRSWGQGDAPKRVTVRQGEAEQNVIKKVPPVYPPLAKATRIQGKVELQALISKTGMVESVNVVSGHPLLVQAAINAVKQWQYKPFVVDGQPVAVSAEIDVPFSLGISDADYQAEQKNNENYFKLEDKCRGLLKEHKYEEAEGPCTSSVELAEKLPKERQLERMTANDLSGEALFFQKKFPQALGFFQRQLLIGEAALKPTDAELGYAYHHAAWGYQATGDTQKAQFYYEQAEATLRRAREHMEGDFFKNQYAKNLQSVLRDYIVLLRQTGQEDAAAQAQKRADAIAEEMHP